MTGTPRRTKRRKLLVYGPAASLQQFPRNSHGWAGLKTSLPGRRCLHAASAFDMGYASVSMRCRFDSKQCSGTLNNYVLRQLRLGYANSPDMLIFGTFHGSWDSSKPTRVGPQTRTARVSPEATKSSAARMSGTAYSIRLWPMHLRECLQTKRPRLSRRSPRCPTNLFSTLLRILYRRSTRSTSMHSAWIWT